MEVSGAFEDVLGELGEALEEAESEIGRIEALLERLEQTILERQEPPTACLICAAPLDSGPTQMGDVAERSVDPGLALRLLCEACRTSLDPKEVRQGPSEDD